MNPCYFAVGVPIGEQYADQNASKTAAQVLVARDYVEVSPSDYRVWLNALAGIENPDIDALHRLKAGNGQFPLIMWYDPESPDLHILASYRLALNGTLAGNHPDAPGQYRVITPDLQTYDFDVRERAIWIGCWGPPTALSHVITRLSQHDTIDRETILRQVWQFVGRVLHARLAYLLPAISKVSS